MNSLTGHACVACATVTCNSTVLVPQYAARYTHTGNDCIYRTVEVMDTSTLSHFSVFNYEIYPTLTLACGNHSRKSFLRCALFYTMNGMILWTSKHGMTRLAKCP